jgi:poly(A) polymerase Pap1
MPMPETPQIPTALIKSIYERQPTVVRIDLNNYLYALDWLQTDEDPQTRAQLIGELERLEQKYGVKVDRKKAAL